MTEQEMPRGETKLDGLIVRARNVVGKMNEIDAVYSPTPAESSLELPSADKRHELLSQWESLNNELIQLCCDIVVEQGGVDALRTIDSIAKNLWHHIDQGSTSEYALGMYRTIIATVTKK